MGFIKRLEKEVDALKEKLVEKEKENAVLVEQVEDLQDAVALLMKANSECCLGCERVADESEWFST